MFLGEYISIAFMEKVPVVAIRGLPSIHGLVEF